MQSYELPNSKVKITFTNDFSEDRLIEFTRELVTNKMLVERFQADTQGELAKMGIEIEREDIKKITDEDLLVALRRRPSPELAGDVELVSPSIVVSVVVSVVTYSNPGPAY
jgi:hypothetical protein